VYIACLILLLFRDERMQARRKALIVYATNRHFIYILCKVSFVQLANHRLVVEGQN